MKIIVGNWKMNGDIMSLLEMYSALEEVETDNTVIICPPCAMLFATPPANVFVGAQDVSAHENGAYTGEISAQMLNEIGARYVIVGHSERRQNHFETNEIVREKAMRALEAGLVPILCVGETFEQKSKGQTFDVLREQIENSIPSSPASSIIIAYEPVWAVSGRGTGLTPTMDEIAKIHEFLRTLTPAPILYGGSVNGDTAAEIMSIPNVDGVLVGAKSLKPDDFIPIIGHS